MVLVHSFEPIIGNKPRIIILGSMPGVVSLQAVQYYANPRNAFWSIMADLFAIEIDCDYEDRIKQISHHPVILWDTIKACHRPGSLDSKIQNYQLEANNIPSLLNQYSEISLVACNGATSEKYFNKLVKTQLPDDRDITIKRLPSTSPANAGMTYEQKLCKWQVIRDYL
ncbi:MAG: DNA-deoxyinosine glycosylase [Gammaproteobacteria bacterium]|nr:DNA-deoxyinosine glycosylase [Gammaproteobacteria bacterium]